MSPLLPIVTTVAARRGRERKRGRAMKIVNLISIDIESAAAASDVRKQRRENKIGI